MLYFDYSATTFPDEKVLKEFMKATKNYRGNPNSSHSLGKKAKERIDDSIHFIANTLDLNECEVIFTSGATEANNLAIKGVCQANKGKHIITTKMEHSSVMAPINRLCSKDYEVDFVDLNEDGTINLDHLQSLIRPDTILVSIVGVDSELGIKQDINRISRLLKGYPNCYFHVDATQMIGKTKTDFRNVDLISFSAHKFFGIKGIGCLIKKSGVRMVTQLDGGTSTTKYRSGTPTLELIVSLEKAMHLAYEKFDDKLEKVKELNTDLKEFFSKYNGIKINNTEKSIDQIINISCENSEKLVKLLNKKEVYVSTKSACSSVEALSKTVMAVYNDKQRANNSIRISISYKTTKDEINKFKKIFDECYKKLGE